MAVKCAHCRSSETSSLFNTFQCLECGKHTTLDGQKILPDSLCIGPNIPQNLEQFGWPFEDPSASHARSDELCALSWGIPLKEST